MHRLPRVAAERQPWPVLPNTFGVETCLRSQRILALMGLSLVAGGLLRSGAPRGASLESPVVRDRPMSRADSPATLYTHVLNRGGRGVQSPADRLLEDGALGREARGSTRREWR